jgi:RNA polymerase-binding transcription factor DksA
VSDDGAPVVGDVAAERAEEMAALRRAQADLADVDRALARLDDGTYGTCEACGVALPDEVLAEAPAARACPEHAAAGRGQI